LAGKIAFLIPPTPGGFAADLSPLGKGRERSEQVRGRSLEFD
jgi:hypothetical protein